MAQPGLYTEADVEIDLVSVLDREDVSVQTFGDVGLITTDRGVVYKTRSGDVFRITIVRAE